MNQQSVGVASLIEFYLFSVHFFSLVVSEEERRRIYWEFWYRVFSRIPDNIHVLLLNIKQSFFLTSFFALPADCSLYRMFQHIVKL